MRIAISPVCLSVCLLILPRDVSEQ